MPAPRQSKRGAGAGANDRDSLTDMTLLHFACKSGADGVGNEHDAANLVRELLSLVPAPRRCMHC